MTCRKEIPKPLWLRRRGSLCPDANHWAGYVPTFEDSGGRSANSSLAEVFRHGLQQRKNRASKKRHAGEATSSTEHRASKASSGVPDESFCLGFRIGRLRDAVSCTLLECGIQRGQPMRIFPKYRMEPLG